MGQETQHRVDLENQLRGTVAAGQLQLVHRPKANLEHSRISGCETLLRWQHPELGGDRQHVLRSIDINAIQRRQPRKKMSTLSSLDLSSLAPSLYAQGTEEMILSRMLERIPPVSRYCVDIGASDGLRNSNTALLLREQGWQGLLVEASSYRYGRLQANYGGARQVKLRHQRVQPDTVDTLLAQAETPEEIDLLSIDIDGNDYWIWRAITACRPRIVVIEYNPYYAPPERWVMCFNPDHEWDGSSYYGASLESLVALGRNKGYELVCCDDMGNNAFFVRSDLYPLLGIANNAPSVLFRPAMYKLRYIGHNTFLSGHPYRHGPAEQI